MKLLRFIITLLMIIGAVGYGVYYFGTNIVSDQVVDAVYTELEESGQLEEVKQMINNDPEIKQFIEEAANVDESKLPVKTKEQATRLLIKKVGISELEDIQTKFQGGISEHEIEGLLKEMEEKLTAEEILALKVIAYKELNK